MILNLEDAPTDPVERIAWLSGVKKQVQTELEAEFQQAYFWARLSGRLDAALSLRQHSQKRVMAYTRAENEARGRLVRWNDGRL